VSELTAIEIPKPLNEKAFEHCNEILWRCLLEDDTVKTYGRSGQKQYGVDLTGIRSNRPDRIVGVQCKLKVLSEELTLDEIESEVNKALQFHPPQDHSTWNLEQGESSSSGRPSIGRRASRESTDSFRLGDGPLFETPIARESVRLEVADPTFMGEEWLQ
jgi:hypothetical protein